MMDVSRSTTCASAALLGDRRVHRWRRHGVRSETQENIGVILGVATDLVFNVKEIAVTETVTVTAQSDDLRVQPHRRRDGVTRQEIATLPTISNRLESFARLTPAMGGNMSFGGPDNRMNNITVDGSYFNNSFGLGGQPGDRTNVAPISMDAIEQVDQRRALRRALGQLRRRRRQHRDAQRHQQLPRVGLLSVAR